MEKPGGAGSSSSEDTPCPQSTANAAASGVAEAWEKEQLRLRDQIKLEDDLSFDPVTFEGLKFIGGVDISFAKEEADAAAATLVVLQYPDMKVVYEETRAVTMQLPYIPGFLAFREVPHLLELLATLLASQKHLFPQVVMVDGNGVLHPRACGLASHLGVLGGVATIGVAKQLMIVDGLSRAKVAEQSSSKLHTKGQSFDLVGDSGRVWGSAVLGAAGSVNPVYVSIGHRISLGAATRLVTACCTQARVPEPIRQADQRSREHLAPSGRVLPKPQPPSSD